MLVSSKLQLMVVDDLQRDTSESVVPMCNTA
jgi:hypothetical protein